MADKLTLFGEVPKEDDKFLYGCGLGCASQLAMLILLLAVSSFIRSPRMGDQVTAFMFATQWLLIIPLIIRQKAKKRPRVVQGLIVAGSLALLLGSTCGYMLLTAYTH